MKKLLPKVSWILALLVLAVGLAISWFALKIQAIDCEIDSQPCDSTQIARFNSLIGQRIIFFDSAKLLHDSSSDSQFKLEKISFKLPHTIQLFLTIQTPAYILATDGTPDTLLISTIGRVIPATSNGSLHEVFVPAQIWTTARDSSQVDQQFHQQLLDVLATLDTNKQPARFVTWIDSQTLALDEPGQPQVILDPTNLRTDLARLKVTQQALESQPPATQVAEVDVRFQLPVLRQNPTITRHQDH